jgi:hypothetical protein
MAAPEEAQPLRWRLDSRHLGQPSHRAHTDPLVRASGGSCLRQTDRQQGRRCVSVPRLRISGGTTCDSIWATSFLAIRRDRKRQRRFLLFLLMYIAGRYSHTFPQIGAALPQIGAALPQIGAVRSLDTLTADHGGSASRVPQAGARTRASASEPGCSTGAAPLP